MQIPPTVVFDLDGTLVATAPDIAAALGRLLAEEGLLPIEEHVAYEFICGGAAAERMIRHSFEHAGHHLSDDRCQRLLQRYFELYAQNLCVRSRLFDGCAECLDELLDRGIILAVCTNKPTALARRLLEELDVADRFAAICGRDAFPVHKPNPRHLTATIARAGGARGGAVMVGDSAVDVASARAARMPVVGVSFGYSSTPMCQLRPDRVVDRYDELPDAVASVAGSPRREG